MAKYSICLSIFAACLSLVLCQQQCNSNTQLPNFLQLNKNLQINSLNMAVREIYNFPYSVTKFDNRPTIIISINKFGCQQFTEIDYTIKTNINDGLVTVLFQSNKMRWTQITINLWLTARTDIFSGTIVEQKLLPNSINQIVVNKQRIIPFFADNKTIYLNFINSLVSSSKTNNYSINCSYASKTESTYTITISAGQNTQIKYIKVDYIVYNLNYSSFASVGGIFSTVNLASQRPYHLRIHKNFAPILYYMIGLDMIRISGSNNLVLDISMDQDFILSTSTTKRIEYVNIVYLTIGKFMTQVCSSCQYAYAYKEKCIDSCPSSTYGYDRYETEGRSCLTCSRKLNQVINNQRTGCQCMKGFKLNLDLCVPEIDQFAFVNNIGIINVSNNVLAVNQSVPNATATNTQNTLNSVVNMDARNQAGNTNVIDSSMLNSGATLLVINNTVSTITDVVSTTTSQGSVSNILSQINNTNQINTIPQAILQANNSVSSLNSSLNLSQITNLTNLTSNVNQTVINSSKSSSEQNTLVQIQGQATKSLSNDVQTLGLDEIINKNCSSTQIFNTATSKCQCDQSSIPISDTQCFKCQVGTFKDGLQCTGCLVLCRVCVSSDTCQQCEQMHVYNPNTRSCDFMDNNGQTATSANTGQISTQTNSNTEGFGTSGGSDFNSFGTQFSNSGFDSNNGFNFESNQGFFGDNGFNSNSNFESGFSSNPSSNFESTPAPVVTTTNTTTTTTIVNSTTITVINPPVAQVTNTSNTTSTNASSGVVKAQSCKQNQLLVNNVCECDSRSIKLQQICIPCNIGQFKNFNAQLNFYNCLQCFQSIENCRQCSNATACQKCQDHYTITNGKCQCLQPYHILPSGICDQCPPGLVFVGGTQICGFVQIVENSSQGQNQQNQQPINNTIPICGINQILEQNICRCNSFSINITSKCQPCQDGFFKINDQNCSPCSANCILCDSPFQCKKCQLNYTYNVLTKVCQASCNQQGKYFDGFSCQFCPAGCSKCSKQAFNVECQSCFINFVFNATTKTCCQNNEDYNFQKGLCQCKLGFNLINGQCGICPEGLIYDDLTKECKLKPRPTIPINITNSSTASNQTIINNSTNITPIITPVVKCSLNQILINNVCVCANNTVKINGVCQQCPQGQFFLNSSCAQCPTTCLRCLNITLCVKCIDGYQGDICKSCSPGFVKTTQNGIQICQREACGNGFVQFGQECDDSNKIDGDGCSSSCLIQNGYACIGQCSRILLKQSDVITSTGIITKYKYSPQFAGNFNFIGLNITKGSQPNSIRIIKPPNQPEVLNVLLDYCGLLPQQNIVVQVSTQSTLGRAKYVNQYNLSERKIVFPALKEDQFLT